MSGYWSTNRSLCVVLDISGRVTVVLLELKIFGHKQPACSIFSFAEVIYQNPAPHTRTLPSLLWRTSQRNPVNNHSCPKNSTTRGSIRCQIPTTVCTSLQHDSPSIPFSWQNSTPLCIVRVEQCSPSNCNERIIKKAATPLKVTV